MIGEYEIICDTCEIPLDGIEKPVIVGARHFCSTGCHAKYGLLKKKTSTVSNTLKERGGRYGPLKIQGDLEQDIKNVLRSSTGWSGLTSDKKCAIEMIAVKLSRILVGDPNYIDNWHDIQGYAKLIEDELDLIGG